MLTLRECVSDVTLDVIIMKRKYVLNLINFVLERVTFENSFSL